MRHNIAQLFFFLRRIPRYSHQTRRQGEHLSSNDVSEQELSDGFCTEIEKNIYLLIGGVYGRSAYLGRAAPRRIWEVDGQTSLHYEEEALIVGGLFRPDHEVSVISLLA